MKRMLLTIAYDGTSYHGWQVQPNGITVQEVLQNSIEKLIFYRPNVTGCSRTDSGVHALEFCCHFDCDEKYPINTFIKGLNSVLPKDICVKNCKEVDINFHSRYNAIGKTYQYNIYNSSVKNPFKSRYFWQIERPLNIDLMNAFCEKIVGTYDFFAFSSSGRSVTDTTRTIKECYVERQNDEIYLTVTANGFLYNMVRIITGTAVGVSDKKIDVDEIYDIINKKDRSRLGITAPPNGLFLKNVLY